jgi:hypothetical protein
MDPSQWCKSYYQLLIASLFLPKWKIHPVFPVDLLTPYKETDLHGPNYMIPPPDLIKGEEEFEVECILDSRHFGCNKKIQYLVKWTGYPDSDNQWANWDQFRADDTLAESKRQNPRALSHIGLAFCVPSSSPSPLMSHSPALSTIKDVVGPTTTTTLQELTVAAPLSALDLEAVLTHFPNPTQLPDKEEYVPSSLTITSGLVPDTPVITRTTPPHQHIPNTSNISNYLPM